MEHCQPTPGAQPEAPGRKQAGAFRGLNAAISSCAGSGTAATIALTHGSPLVAIIACVSAQMLAVFSLTHQLWLHGKYWHLYEEVARARLNNPGDKDLPALLRDIAATHPPDIGDRIAAHSSATTRNRQP